MASTPGKESTAESLAERYAGGRMQDAEEQEFEAQMLEDPALAAEVDAIHRMRQGFKLLRARGELGQPSRGRRFGMRQYALAAALLILVVGAGALAIRMRLASPGSPPILTSSLAALKRPSAAAAPASFFLAHTRGDEGIPEIRGARGSDVVALKILPAVAGDSNAYRATLERLEGSAPVRLATDLEARSDGAGYVVLYLNTAGLATGSYRLSLSQQSGREEFVFHVSKGQ